MDTRLTAGTPDFLRANLALALGGFVCFMLLYATQPLLPEFAAHFGVSPTQASLTVSGGTLAMSLLLIPLSLLSDRYGRVWIMQWALAGATFFGLLSALVPGFQTLILTRVGIGACIAGLPAAAMAYLGEELEPAARARAMGLYIAANALGGMFGRLVAGALTEWLGWRYGLGVLGVIGVFATALFWQLIPAARHFESRTLAPLVLFADIRRIYADAGLPWLFMTAFLGMGAFVSTYNYLGFHLTLPPYGLGTAAISGIFLLYALGSVASGSAGYLTDRFGRSQVLLSVIGMTLAGLLLTLVQPLWGVVSGLAIFTFGFFATHAVASGWVGHRAGERRGLVSALYLSSYYLGSSVIGSSTGLLWSQGGWPTVVSGLLVLVGLVALIGGHLHRRCAEAT